MFYKSDTTGIIICNETGAQFTQEHWMYRELVQPWLDAGNTLHPEPAPQMKQEEIISMVDKAIEAWLNAFVQQRNYKSIESCISYVDDEDSYFAAEGLAAKRWRSAVYREARAMLTNTPEGVTPANILQHLPQPEDFNWPVRMVQPMET